MARPLRIAYPGALQHLTSRGNEQRPVFREDADRHPLLADFSQYHRTLFMAMLLLLFDG